MIFDDDGMSFNSEIFDRNQEMLLEGYWQTEKYFFDSRSEILYAFRFPDFVRGSKNWQFIDEMANRTVVAMHVRREDYLKIANTSGICTDDYYNKAIKLLIDQCNPDMFLFFSDGIEWCKNHFNFLSKNHIVEFVDWNVGYDTFRDMQLMSLSSHNIIANSSFSWCGAWLNNNPEKSNCTISVDEWFRMVR